MLVKAIQRGQYKHVREVGEEFEVPDGMTGSWFVLVATPAGPHADDAPRRGRPPKSQSLD